jgi:nucleoid DNA-binding protein
VALRSRARLLIWNRVKKRDIVKRMAQASGVSPGEAADRLDRVVRDILANVRKGKAMDLPGLGRFIHGDRGQVAFQREPGDE